MRDVGRSQDPNIYGMHTSIVSSGKDSKILKDPVVYLNFEDVPHGSRHFALSSALPPHISSEKQIFIINEIRPQVSFVHSFLLCLPLSVTKTGTTSTARNLHSHSTRKPTHPHHAAPRHSPPSDGGQRLCSHHVPSFHCQHATLGSRNFRPGTIH